MTLPENPMQFIRQKFGANVTISYMPNGGNLGDALIAASTIQAFDSSSISWKILKGGKENLLSTDVLVYGGGGSLVNLYKGGIACLKFLQSLGRPIIVLPHTVRGHEDFWRAASDITVFCRDFASLDYLKNFSNIECHFSHDMATQLDLSKPPYDTILRYAKLARERNLILSESAFFREDDEKSSLAHDDVSLDISALSHPSMASKEDIQCHAAIFLSVISHSKTIKTNRLHVSVAAGLLGIPTILYDNNYGKNRSIFEATLQKRFPCIKFVEN